MNAYTTRSRPCVSIFWILILICLGILAGCHSPQEEKDARLEDAITKLRTAYNLTVGEAKGDGRGGAVLTNVALTLPSEKGPLAVTMESVTAEGIAYDKLFADGKARLVGKLVITGLTVKGDTFETVSERYEVEGLDADPATFAAEVAAMYRGGAEFCQWLGGLALPGEDAIAFADVSDTTEYSHSIERCVSTAEKTTLPYRDNSMVFFTGVTEAADLAAHKYGKLVMKDAWGEYGGKRFFSLAELGVHDAVFPDDETRVPGFDDAELGKNPMNGDCRVGEFSLQKFAFTPLASGGKAIPFTAEHIGYSLDFTDARQQVSMAFTALAAAKSDLLAGAALLAQAERFRAIAEFLPETVSTDGNIVMDVLPLPDGGFSLSFKPFAFTFKDMATFSLSVDMRGESLDSEKAEVGLVDLTMTDYGLSDLIFVLVGEQQGKTGDFLRQEVRMGLSAAGFSLQGSLATLCANLLDFLEKPGATLNLTIKPEEMIEAETLGFMLMTDPDKVGLSSSVTRDGGSEKAATQ